MRECRICNFVHYFSFFWYNIALQICGAVSLWQPKFAALHLYNCRFGLVYHHKVLLLLKLHCNSDFHCCNMQPGCKIVYTWKEWIIVMSLICSFVIASRIFPFLFRRNTIFIHLIWRWNCFPQQSQHRWSKMVAIQWKSWAGKKHMPGLCHNPMKEKALSACPVNHWAKRHQISLHLLSCAYFQS